MSCTKKLKVDITRVIEERIVNEATPISTKNIAIYDSKNLLVQFRVRWPAKILEVRRPVRDHLSSWVHVASKNCFHTVFRTFVVNGKEYRLYWYDGEIDTPVKKNSFEFDEFVDCTLEFKVGNKDYDCACEQEPDGIRRICYCEDYQFVCSDRILDKCWTLLMN